MSQKLIELVQHPPPKGEPPIEPVEAEQESATVYLDKSALETHGRWGQPSLFTCSDCGGTLWEFAEEAVLHYRCHLDHAYSMLNLAQQQNEQVRHALWSAVRALEERASLSRRLALRYQESGRVAAAARFSSLASDAEREAHLLQQVILDNETSIIR